MVIKNEVFWKNPGYKGYSKLNEDIECDYLIVGGGISGVSLAYFLSKFKAGKIVLIEKDQIGSGATGKAAGTLAIRGEADFHDFVNKLGKKNAILYWNEIHKTLNLIKKIISHENIDCDSESQDTLYCGFKHKSRNDLNLEFEYEKEIEKDSRMLLGDSLINEFNAPLYSHAILSKNHGLSVNPLKLTQNLSKVARKYGVAIYENTKFLKSKNKVAKTNCGDISFKKLIIAIDSDHPSKYVKKLKTSIIVTRVLSRNELIKTGMLKKRFIFGSLFSKKIFFDNKENYEYGKLTKDNRLLLGFGGIITNKSSKDNIHIPHIGKLSKFLKSLFPYLDLEIDYGWSASFGITQNYEPLIKNKGDHLFIAGAGTQPGCVMAAHYLAHNLTNRKSSLDRIFKLKQDLLV